MANDSVQKYSCPPPPKSYIGSVEIFLIVQGTKLIIVNYVAQKNVGEDRF